MQTHASELFDEGSESDNKLSATGSVHSKEVDGISQANPQNFGTTARIVLYF